VLDSQGAPQGIAASLGTVRVVRPAVPPELSALLIATPVEQPLSEELLLLGYDLPKPAGEAGGVLPLSLYWQAQRNVQGDYLVQVALLDEKGELWAESLERPVGGTYTTTQWVQGEILRDRLDLRIPATVPIGSYLLRVGVVPAGPTKATAEVTLGEVKIEGRAHRFDVPQIGQPLQANFGDKIELLGYDMDGGSGRQGQPLRVAFYWRALSEMSTSYKVFTHLLGAEARIWGQKDDFPGGSTLLTTSWVKGEVVIDPYEIPLDPNIPPGSYRLEVGFYDPASGQRLPVVNAEGQPSADHVVLPAIDVRSR
jgi:hypothetical protein